MKKTILALVLVFAMILSCLAGCSSKQTSDQSATANTAKTDETPADTSTETPTDSTEQTTTEGSFDSSAILAELEPYTTQSAYSIEGATPIDVKNVMKDKSVYVIPASVSTPFNSVTCQGMLDICTELGIKSDWYATNGSIDSWIAAIETAVNQGYDIIGGFSGVIPEVLSSQIEYAEKNDIPVVDLHFHDFADKDTCDDTYCLPADYELAGYILALWAIYRCEAQGDVAIVTSQELDASLAMEKGIKAAFAKYAPDMGQTYLHVVVTDWATKIQTEVQNALVANPDIKYVINLYDVMTTYTVAAIEAVGKTGEVKVCAYNGTPFALDLIKQGLVDMDLGECLECMSYCLLDQMFRIAAGEEPLPAENPPFYIWTADNVDQAIGEDGKAGWGGYDQSYLEFYQDLWMLNQ